jgi:hypothetical protein
VRARCGTPEGRAERARQGVMNRNVHISFRRVAIDRGGLSHET